VGHARRPKRALAAHGISAGMLCHQGPDRVHWLPVGPGSCSSVLTRDNPISSESCCFFIDASTFSCLHWQFVSPPRWLVYLYWFAGIRGDVHRCQVTGFTKKTTIRIGLNSVPFPHRANPATCDLGDLGTKATSHGAILPDSGGSTYQSLRFPANESTFRVGVARGCLEQDSDLRSVRAAVSC